MNKQSAKQTQTNNPRFANDVRGFAYKVFAHLNEF